MPRPTPSSKRPLLIWSSMQISSTRMVERKRIDQRTEAQALRALSHRGEENAGRGGKAERRRVMFGGVVRIEAAAVVGFDDLQPLLVERVQRTIVAIEVVENADFHSSSSKPRVGVASSAKARGRTRSAGHAALHDRRVWPILRTCATCSRKSSE